MTTDDLNRMAAEARGYTVFPNTATLMPQDTMCIRQRDCPEYSRSHDAAQELVEMVAKKCDWADFSFALRRIVSEESPQNWARSKTIGVILATPEQKVRAALIALGRLEV